MQTITDKKDLRIVFMGTPDFAVQSLAALVEGGYNVVGVVTMPDKAIGRHQSQVAASPVKQYAVAHDLPVLQPEKLRDETFLTALRTWQADLQVVVAFRMLPEVVWAMPPRGTFNLHAALLPQYRGAAPINWAVINGETQTGVTTFFLDHDIDTGRIIERVPVPIATTDDAGIVHDKLMTVGADLVVRTVDAVMAGTLSTQPQCELAAGQVLRHAPKIFKDTCRIDFTRDAKQVYDFIRGLSPYPAAWTELQVGDAKPLTLKIFRTDYVLSQHDDTVGAVIIEDGAMRIALRDGYLRVLTLQLAGKKRMEIADFLNGFHVTDAICVR